MRVRFLCPRCGAPLAPGFGRLLCPRLTACGRGGRVERGGAPSFAAASDAGPGRALG